MSKKDQSAINGFVANENMNEFRCYSDVYAMFFCFNSVWQEKQLS